MFQLPVCVPRIDRSMIPGLTLGGVWFAGVSLGLWAARFYGDSVMALALTAGHAELSFLRACLVSVLPLFFSAFAVSFFHRSGAWVFCALRGLVLGFLLGAFSAVGGLWLGGLLLFSGLCSSPVLLWFLRRRMVNGRRGIVADCVGSLLVLCVVSAVDTWAVAPFLARALSF